MQQHGWSSQPWRRRPRSTRYPQLAHRISMSSVRELRQGLLALGVPRLVFWTHPEVVLSLWRHPAEERRPRTLAPAVGFTSALEAAHALCLRGSGQECGAQVEPDDREEYLSHVVILRSARRTFLSCSPQDRRAGRFTIFTTVYEAHVRRGQISPCRESTARHWREVWRAPAHNGEHGSRRRLGSFSRLPRYGSASAGSPV